MLSKEEILNISQRALKQFKVDCNVSFLPYGKFKSLAEKAPSIRRVLTEGVSFEELKIPALIYHKHKEHIFLNKKIINSLINDESTKTQKMFIKSLVYHEIFHILHEKEVKRLSFKESMRSEDRVYKDFKRRFPKLYEIGYKIHKKGTSFL